jgi:hypothetical protein
MSSRLGRAAGRRDRSPATRCSRIAARLGEHCAGTTGTPQVARNSGRRHDQRRPGRRLSTGDATCSGECPDACNIACPVLAANQPVPALLAGTRPVGSTRFQAIAYFSSTIHQTSAGAPVAAEGRLQHQAALLGVDHQFSKAFSATVLTDIRNVVGTTSNGNNASNRASSTPVARALFIKNAYLQATVSPALTVRLGRRRCRGSYLEGQHGYRHHRKFTGRTGEAGQFGRLGRACPGRSLRRALVLSGPGRRRFGLQQRQRPNTSMSKGASRPATLDFMRPSAGMTASGQIGVDHDVDDVPAGLSFGTAARSGGGKSCRSASAANIHAKNFASINSTTEDSSLGYAPFSAMC